MQKFLKYLPRHMKAKSLPRPEGTEDKKKTAEENASRAELKERLKAKIMELREKTKKKIRTDESGNIINKKIRKEKFVKADKGDKGEKQSKNKKKDINERGRSKSKDAQPEKKDKARNQSQGQKKGKGKAKAQE